MAKYQKYAEYQDSGIEWLGKIPRHWTITSLKRFSFVKGGYAFSSDIFTSVGKPYSDIRAIEAINKPCSGYEFIKPNETLSDDLIKGSRQHFPQMLL